MSYSNTVTVVRWTTGTLIVNQNWNQNKDSFIAVDVNSAIYCIYNYLVIKHFLPVVGKKNVFSQVTG